MSGSAVFPEREEVLVGGESASAGEVGIRALRSSRLQGIRPGHAQMRQRSCPTVPDDAAVVDDLLKLVGGFFALSCCQVCLSANVYVIEAGNIGEEVNLPKLDS
jgi:hypothetical protein